VNPRGRAILYVGALLVVSVLLLALFPVALGFVQLAARNIRHLWWLILLVALACWLIWGVGRKPKL
jgi:hypothetical protein